MSYTQPPTDARLNPYDDVPYPSHAFPATAPERLAMVGALFGLRTPDPATARVLELGSSSGGQLLPHALLYPGSTALGLDLSPVQITLGQHTAAALGAHNLRLEVADLATWRPEPGAWDYVICHGVYSWVPPEVQRSILQICRAALSPHGVAAVSWNANPGWHVQGMLRDAMRFLVDPHAPLAHRAARGKDVVRVLASTLSDAGSPHARLLQTMATSFELLPDSYIAHEYLEQHNQPLYLAEFTQHAARADLRYLSDSHVSHGLPQLLDPQLQQRLAGLARTQIELEQYLDFFAGRPFRTSLLVRPDAPVQRALDRFNPAGLWLSRAHPPHDDAAAWPLGHALSQVVHRRWPQRVPFDQAAREACDEAGVQPSPAALHELTQAVLAGVFTDGLGLHHHPTAAVGAPGPTPTAWPLSRYQAARQHLVVNQRYESLALEPVDLLLLHLADGARTLTQIADRLLPLLQSHPELAPSPEHSLADRLQLRYEQLGAQGYLIA